ncbi:SMI1/KNR4 family protein [Litchfieldia salsa]|uniref:SMI1-KNR4 cell-wall n=1 Tax=Litchfieldia salsa TaxID=930152 RepID=A0A1H0TY31_9BACI|nr:SMI1/KNR4 family protein [Litchfieldia salsa]SDP58675.1 SMI1-KNR4 cell-wall [Litchfieldia salsa]
MDLNSIRGLILNPPANVMELEKVKLKMNTKLPTSYKELLLKTNGVSTKEGIILYGTQDLIERNETWETEVYAPGFISIGDDSGGRVILMRKDLKNKEVLIADSGDMTPENALLISTDLIQWVKNGLTIVHYEKPEVNWLKNAKLVVVDTQDGALKDLIKIKSILALDIATSELVKGAKNLPFVLTEEVPYGKAKKIIEELGELKVKIELQ